MNSCFYTFKNCFLSQVRRHLFQNECNNYVGEVRQGRQGGEVDGATS